MNNNPNTLSASFGEIEEHSWNRQRSVEQLRAFVMGREAELDVADFDL